MTNSTAIITLINVSSKLGAIVDHVCNNNDYSDPVELSDPQLIPDEEISNDLAEQVSSLKNKVDSFATWARNN